MPITCHFNTVGSCTTRTQHEQRTMKTNRMHEGSHATGHPLRSALKTAVLALPLGMSFNLEAAPPPGRLLAAQCSQCHGTNGQAVSGFESISGKNAGEMYKELLEMSRRRPESIMDLQVRAYTPAQLRLIADYLATLPRGNNEQIDD